MKKIGMRNLKTAIAVFICIIITRVLNIADSPFYACIAAVICMQSSVFQTFKAGKNRMIGTFIGAFLGFLFALINPGNALLTAVGIIVVIYICDLMKYNKSVSIACIVFIAIMVNLKDQTPFYYSIYRLIETLIGIIIALLVNYFICPPKYLDNLYKVKEDIVETLDKLFYDKLFENKNIDLSNFNKQISLLESLLKSYKEEIIPKKNDVHKISNLQNVLKLSKKAYSHLFMLNSLNENCILNEENITMACDLLNITKDRCLYDVSDLNVVYNYHISNLFDIKKKLDMKHYTDMSA